MMTNNIALLGKEVQIKVPPSDPISCFTSDNEEMLHAPTRKGKRPFEEVNLDSKAGKHGSPEAQKRRNSGPPQLQTWHTLHTVREKGKEPIFDAARFWASVETDRANDIESKREACQISKANVSRQLLTDQQIGFEENVTMDQAQANGSCGVRNLEGSTLGCRLQNCQGGTLEVAGVKHAELQVQARGGQGAVLQRRFVVGDVQSCIMSFGELYQAGRHIDKDGIITHNTLGLVPEGTYVALCS